MAQIDVYVSAAPVRVEVSGAQGPAGVDNPTAAFASNKATIVDADRFALLDSGNSNLPKHGLWSLIKSTLKTYFDTLYLNQNTTGNAGTVTTINGRIAAGTNVSLAGTGTAASPYVISSTGGGGTEIVISETAPSDLTVGWFDPTDGVLAYYIGGGWVTQQTGGVLTPDGTITFGGDTLTFGGDILTFTA